MKQSIFAFLGGVIITAAIFYFICHKNSTVTGNESTKDIKKPTIEVSDDSAALKWHKLETLYNEYIKRAMKKKEERAAANKSLQPVDVEIGKTYMESYRESLTARSDPSNTLSLLIDDTTLAFYTKYLLDNKLTEVQASFARFDSVLLKAKGLDDPVLMAVQKGRNMKYTLMFGVKDSERTRAKYALPFIVGEYSFFDDWNAEWP